MDYYEAREKYWGWCPICQAWTRENTEPDAVGYDCPACGEQEVVGADNFLEAMIERGVAI
jgi:predicted RNA-binding Zn-ribbon protein involved in translation (DUF1610 family)